MIQNQQEEVVYFIRHANSLYNCVQSSLMKKYGVDNYRNTQQFLYQKFNPQYLDVQISQKGKKQAQQCREKIKEIHIDLVIVSPFRRALQTCAIIFQNHKNNPKILVDPQFRQIISSSNDIGSRLDQSMKQFPQIDFSLIKHPQFWYLQNFRDLKMQQQLLKQILDQNVKNKKQKGVQIGLKFIKQFYKQKLQRPNDKEILKKALPDLDKQKQIIIEHLKNYKKIAIISHNYTISCYVGSKVKNCQIIPFSRKELQTVKF